MGSRWFIVIQTSALLLWIVVDSLAWRNDWDPYPFILLNLVLSFQAAFAAPVPESAGGPRPSGRHAGEEIAAIQTGSVR